MVPKNLDLFDSRIEIPQINFNLDDLDTSPEYFLSWIESKIDYEKERKRRKVEKSRDIKINNIIGYV